MAPAVRRLQHVSTPYPRGRREDFLPDPVPAVGAAQRHFSLEVVDLEGWRQRLEEAGVETSDQTPIPNRPRFFCSDPLGNLIELTTITGDYRT